MRLIDADALLKHEVEADRMGAMLVVGKGYILDAPTIEAVQVVRGEWINKEPPNADNNIYCTCSNCSAGDLHAVDAVVPYCWKCGAKMDKEDKPCE